MTEKRPLQITTMVLALIPIVTGILGMFGVRDPLYTSAHLRSMPLLDSNLRFFGGVWLALGIALLWLVPAIERRSVLFRAVWFAVFVGGIGRIFSMVAVGLPPPAFVAFTLLELVGAPFMVYWQQGVAARAARTRFRRASDRSIR